MHLIGPSACFFELDGVVRRLKRSVALHHIDEHYELPPNPMATGQQELIEPVVEWIKSYCVEHGAIPIGVDQAPYLSHGFDIDRYEAINAELIGLLREAGLPVKEIAYCPHAGEEETVFDLTPTGRAISAVRFTPTCGCKFPNPDLFKAMATKYNVPVLNIHGQYQFLNASCLVYVTPEARQAAIEQCGLDGWHVNNIRSGKGKLPGLVRHEHLKAAALIRDHQRKHGLTTAARGTVELDARSLPDLPALPPEFDRPVTELRPG